MSEDAPPAALPAIVALPPSPVGAFDPSFAAAMARLADIAYSAFELDGGLQLRTLLAPGALDLHTTFTWLPSDKGTGHLSWRDRGVQGYLASGENYAALVFRGTSDTKDWLTDVRARKRVVRGDGRSARVHAGFANAYFQIAAKVETAVAQLMASRPRPLFIVGHSLGGAMAQIALASLNYDQIAASYTFGCPKVSGFWFRRHAGGPHHRIVNGWDVVPELPSLSKGYAHTEVCWHLRRDPPNTSLSRHRSLLCSVWIDLRDLAGLAFATNWAGVRDHRLANYVARLDAVAKP